MTKSTFGLTSNHLCGSWQGFIQQIVYQVSRGYDFYCLTYLPAEKLAKWPKIDGKLIAKYNAGLSKDQRYRAKLLGQANFVYLRWEHCALLLHTQGSHGPIDDSFFDIRRTPLAIQISPAISLLVHHGPKGVTVHLSRQTFLGIKAILHDAARGRESLLREFSRLNGLPCWSGIIEQKRQLLSFCLKRAKTAGIKLHKVDFRLETHRKIYKVWETPAGSGVDACEIHDG